MELQKFKKPKNCIIYSYSCKVPKIESNSKSNGNDERHKLIIEIRDHGYYIGKRIGSGTYSKVYYAEQRFQGIKSAFPVACKIIDKKYLAHAYDLKFVLRELRIIQTLSHPNIVPIYSILNLNINVCFFMELSPYGDLLEFILRKGALNESTIKRYLNQLCSAIEYLHFIGVSHRDIKCENILLYTLDCVKLTDFGFARRILKNGKGGYSRTFCGSFPYAPPEVLKGLPYDPKAFDMWSMGCVVYVMATGEILYKSSDISAIVQQQENRCIKFPSSVKINSQIIDIIRCLLEPNVKNRFTIEDLVLHSFLI